MTKRLARRDHADNAACGAGQDRILAAKGADFGQPSIGLHEAQASRLGKARTQTVGVAPKDRREIGVDHSGIAAWDKADEGRDFVADADLREAKLAGDGRETLFMRAILPAMHEDDGKRVDTIFAQCFELRARRVFVERRQDLAIGSHPLIDFYHLRRQLFRQNDMPGENLGPCLIADPQRIAEAACGRQSESLSLAFEQGIGRDRGPYPHFGNRACAMMRHQPPHRLACRVVVMIRVFRQQLVGHQMPGGGNGHDVGESAAAIDCEAPCAGSFAHAHRLRFACATPKFKRLERKPPPPRSFAAISQP